MSTYKDDLEMFLSLPVEKKDYIFSDDSEKFIHASLKILNKLFPNNNKIVPKKFKALVKELYRHPTVIQGGGNTPDESRVVFQKNGTKTTPNDDSVIIEMEMRSNVMDFQMVSSIVMLLFSVYIAYLVYVRYCDLDRMVGISGQADIVLNSFKKAIESNRDVVSKDYLSFFMMWGRYFHNIGNNIFDEESKLILDLLKKTCETTTETLLKNLEARCMNPASVADWASAWLVPGSVTECMKSITINTTLQVQAEQGLLIAEITKKKDDLVGLARLSHGLGTFALLSILHKVGYLRNPPTYMAKLSKSKLLALK